MSARQPLGIPDPAFRSLSSSVTAPLGKKNLFVQIDLFAAAEEALAKKINEHGYTDGQGKNPPWTLAFISEHYRHRSASDHPTLRLALVALQQLAADLNAGPAGAEFYRAIDWINENDSPFFSFDRICGELEVQERVIREQIAEIFPQHLRAGGRLNIIHSLVDPPKLSKYLAEKTAKNEADDRAYRLELLTAHRNRMPASGSEHHLQKAWAKVVQSRIQQERADAKEAAGLPTRPPMSSRSIDLVRRAQELVRAGKRVSDACVESKCGLSAYLRYERLQSPSATPATA